MALEATSPSRSSVRELKPRLYLGLGLVGIFFFALLVRLYGLQILRGEEMSVRGQENYVRRVRIHHNRGIVFDRWGKILVDNRASLDLFATPAFLGDQEEASATLDLVFNNLSVSSEEAQPIHDEVISRRRTAKRFQPVRLARDLSPEQIEIVEHHRALLGLHGIEIVEGQRRDYRFGKLGAHFLGYVNEIDGPGLDRARRDGNPFGYALGDLIGRDGLERTHERDLRGRDGWEKLVQDATGRRLEGEVFSSLLGEQSVAKPEPGHNVYLTIDAELQALAEQAFDGRAGAVVAMNPQDGGIRALVSRPSFDPNLVSGQLGREEKTRLDSDPLKPWVNRATQGQYAPGSTFKIVTALAALSAENVTPDEKVKCPGWFRMGRHTWRCHKDSGHGQVDLREALKVSCDTYFYTMAQRMGIEPIAAMSRKLGFGARTGIGLRNEKSGLVPDEAFHDRVEHATGGYQKGMAVNTSIGQGAVLVTPLQLALAYAAIANGGRIIRPQLVERIETADFRVVRQTVNEQGDVVEEVVGQQPSILYQRAAEVTRELDIPKAWLDAVHKGLVAVTSERGGTAYWRRSRIVSMAGKTGTAQVIRLGKDRLDADEMAYEERDHAWFVAYAPAESPEIVVAVLNEHSGHGGSQAAPIAVRVIDAYFETKALRAKQATTTVGTVAP